jgi:hypothetical protein
MPFNVLLLPLLGGFILVTRWNHTRFRTKRYSGERLIFFAAIAGVFLALMAFLLVRIAAWMWPELASMWQRHVPFEYAGTSLLAFFLGFLLWRPLNRWSPRANAVRSMIEQWNDFLEMLLQEALEKTLMVSISLKGGEVYIGFITSNYDPSYDRKYIRLWPILIGYRNKDTQELAVTTNYANVYAETVSSSARSSVVDQFQVIVPVGELQTASFFDPKTYDLFNPPGESDLAWRGR